jgi:hypothetical protein
VPNNDIEFHNKLFNTDDCVITWQDDPTPEEIEAQKIQEDILAHIENRRQEIITELNELDRKVIRPLLDSETEKVDAIKAQKILLREELETL